MVELELLTPALVPDLNLVKTLEDPIEPVCEDFLTGATSAPSFETYL